MRKELTGYSIVDPVAVMSPAQRMEHIRETDRTLDGFIKVLKIIEKAQKEDADSCPFLWDQERGSLPVNWLEVHNLKCAACMGALLSWFFNYYEDGYGHRIVANHDGARGHFRNVSDSMHDSFIPEGFGLYETMESSHEFELGIRALSDHLGMECKWDVDEDGKMPDPRKDVLETKLGQIIRDLGGCAMAAVHPFGRQKWRVSAVKVFEKFAANFKAGEYRTV